MSAPLTQWAGETAANFRYRQQQAIVPASGPNKIAAAQWVAAIVTAPASPPGFTVA